MAVFARVTPSHKVRIVDAYRRHGSIVAMTGDGANDAPAIRLADVGIALGDNATPAARAAADLVVPDGRIETIVAAIVEGRALWGTLREALAILLGGNLGEIGFTVAGTLVGGRPPLSARQLLLVNLMTDVAPGDGGGHAPTSRCLARGPLARGSRRVPRIVAATGDRRAGGHHRRRGGSRLDDGPPHGARPRAPAPSGWPRWWAPNSDRRW